MEESVNCLIKGTISCRRERRGSLSSTNQPGQKPIKVSLILLYNLLWTNKQNQSINPEELKHRRWLLIIWASVQQNVIFFASIYFSSISPFFFVLWHVPAKLHRFVTRDINLSWPKYTFHGKIHIQTVKPRVPLQFYQVLQVFLSQYMQSNIEMLCKNVIKHRM